MAWSETEIRLAYLASEKGAVLTKENDTPRYNAKKAHDPTKVDVASNSTQATVGSQRDGRGT